MNFISFRIFISDIELISIETNLVDSVWVTQPQRVFNQIISLDKSITGKTIADALKSIRSEMTKQHASISVVTALDEVACKQPIQIEISLFVMLKENCFCFSGLLNLRGSDIAYNPVFYGYAIITPDDLYIFVEKSKLPANFDQHFAQNEVTVGIHDYADIKNVLTNLISTASGKIWICPNSSYALSALVPPKKLVQELSPVCELKAIKNPVEAQGMINCHIRDGLALCKYFAWLEDALNRGVKVDEISGADKLEEFRS